MRRAPLPRAGHPHRLQTLASLGSRQNACAFDSPGVEHRIASRTASPPKLPKSTKIHVLVFVERFGNGAEDGLKYYFDLGLFPANLHRHYVN